MIDLEKISQLNRIVDSLIEMDGTKDNLSDEMIDDYIKRSIIFTTASLSNDEIAEIKKNVTFKYQVYTTPGQSIVDDYDQEKWYDDAKKDITPYFWNRYKDYLIDEKHFSPNVVSTLGEETLDANIMNYLGNPNSSTDFLRRGLIIGDVQSGKTSTYIGLICKAADAGYKVFILLTGTIESLRRQTQERVEEGFIGINMSADTTGGQRVGVGLDNKPIRAMGLTSRKADFTGESDQIAVSLQDKNAVVFVIKKNSSVLKNLTEWLISLNANPITHKIDLPVLIIDDEADNASINTSKDKEDPTKINRMIRELANVFTKSNYVGFTATPFANVFIDPETPEKMEMQDLFPEDFIVALPTPSNYIGPMQIFAPEGRYHSQIIYINDAGEEAADGWPFYYKHKKEWEGDLPNSLTDAVFSFYIANAIRDLRGDAGQHRSMLINISRFVMVQKYIKEQMEQLHDRAYRAIKFNLSSDFNASMKDPILKRIYSDWEKYYSNLEFSWEEIVETLFASIENIQIKIVNSSKSSEKLDYNTNEGVRVIAIGGLALSRGLTLEGLVVSYFYRNTSTYDVLMQMGRWFGYRRGYDDLFRIWTHKESAEWYAEIAESTEQLKDDMKTMRELEMKPKSFGIRVRNNSTKLKITAANKMRNSSEEYEYESYYGGYFETPYMTYDIDIQKANYKITEAFLEDNSSQGERFVISNPSKSSTTGGNYLLQDIPKIKIMKFLKDMDISKANSKFDKNQIIDFLRGDSDDKLNDWDVIIVGGSKNDDRSESIDISGIKVYESIRGTSKFKKADKRLMANTNGRLGGPTDGMHGISDYNGLSAETIIQDAKNQFIEQYKKDNFGQMPKSGKVSYTSDTWFKYVKDRKPALYLYFLKLGTNDNNQKKQEIEFLKEMNGIPVVGIALGIPNSDNAELVSRNRYKANKVYNWFEREEIVAESEEE